MPAITRSQTKLDPSLLLYKNHIEISEAMAQKPIPRQYQSFIDRGLISPDKSQKHLAPSVKAANLKAQGFFESGGKTDFTVLVLGSHPDGVHAESSIQNKLQKISDCFQKNIKDSAIALYRELKNARSARKSKAQKEDELSTKIQQDTGISLQVELMRFREQLILSVTLNCDQLGLASTVIGRKDCIRFYSKKEFESVKLKGNQLGKFDRINFHFSYSLQNSNIKISHIEATTAESIQFETSQKHQGLSSHNRKKGRERTQAHLAKYTV